MAGKAIVLDIQNLQKSYKKRTVVKDVSIKGYEGEVLGFLGPNGAGKTTTIKIITGLVKKDSGSVYIQGHNIDNELELAIKNVGAIVETPHLYENMTGLENLKLFSMLKCLPDNSVNEMIDLIGIAEQIKDKVKNYSLGMKQRLAIGVAMLGNPKLLILDEPTNGLDPVGIKALRDFLKHLAHEKNVCVLVSSHMLFEMQQTCDRVVIISKGEIIGSANIEDLEKEGKTLEDIYLDLTKERSN